MLKRFLNKNSAFTLTELLVTLTIIGVISAMAIPALVENLHKRTMVAQVKGIFGSIQQVARDQMLYNKASNLKDTDFADPAKLLTDKNFQITKKCRTGNECWSTSYKNMNNGSANDRVKGEYIESGKSIILRNGAILTYTTKLTTAYPVMTGTGDKVMGMFRVDVNGTDKPNIVGRDIFWFFMTEKGRVVDYYTATNTTFNKDTALTNCKSAAIITACLSLIQRNNWVMDY